MQQADFDVIIVGAGPSGSACAIYMGKAGKRVLLIDKATFPRDKTCGDAISGKSMAILKDLDLVDRVAKTGAAKINGVLISSPKGIAAEIDNPKPDETFLGFVCKRQMFDNLVFQEAKKHATVMEGLAVMDLIFDNSRVVGIKAKDAKGQDHEFISRMVVGADGATSVVAQKLGLELMDPPNTSIAVRAYYDGVEGMTNRIEIHFVDEVMPGYFWIFPTGDKNEANVGLGMLVDARQERNVNLVKLMDEIVEKNPLMKGRFKNAKKKGKIVGWNLPLGSKPREMVFDGALLIGDAAGLIDPFSGEGIGNGMLSARVASKVILKDFYDNDFSKQNLGEYRDELLKEIGGEFKNSTRLQRFLKHKWLLNFAIKRIHASKEFRDMLAGTFINESPIDRISITPGTLWRMLIAR